MSAPIRTGLLAYGLDIINYKLLTNYSITFIWFIELIDGFKTFSYPEKRR
jgi:hypothetical protein